MTEKKDGFEAEKQRILSAGRRVIFNNDGGDAKKLPESGLENPRDFLDIRTSPLAGSHVDTVSYCTSRGFGVFTHKTNSGRQDISSPVVSGLAEQGTDPLEVMAGYCHANGMQMLWSMRMNDTHDAGRPERFKENPFKSKNRDCLLGTEDDRPAYGGWSAVNYGCARVRDMVLSFVGEVCRNYDADGIELDFFRHPVFFRKTSRGEPVEERDRENMTALMRKIALTAEKEGRARGRPFLIAARVPDDAAYCVTIGLEIERWMSEKLIDIYIPGAYFRLNSWRYSVRLGHKYGVRVYPGLSESRVGGGHHADKTRASDECYRARAANVWNAGADGIYMFNLFDPRRRIWGEIGEPEELEQKDKAYFASVRGAGRVAGGAYPHAHFMNIPRLNPDAPMAVRTGCRKTVRIEMAEKGFPARGNPPEITLFVGIVPDIENVGDLTVSFNGNELCGRVKGGKPEFSLRPGYVRNGTNTLEIFYRGRREKILVSDVMAGVDYSGSFLGDESYIERTRERM